jgi:hypothetical protein
MPVQLARTDHPDHPVKTAPQAQMAVPAQRVTKADPARLVHPATTALPATRAHLVRTDPRENRVFAPNIAPPMVVFSSKMEQGDKRSSLRRRVCYNDEKPVFFMSIFFAVINFFVFNISNVKTVIVSTNSIILNTATTAASPVISFGAF